MTDCILSADVADELQKLDVLRSRLNDIVFGKREQIELLLACLLSGGHVLLDDLPGTGKTTLAKALAGGLGGRLARVQCTPDLLPSDITGFRLFNQKSREFEFHPGPVFADILLADEINRTTPRTQSALLEAMAERQVTIDSVEYSLTPTFFVIATQNPIDSHGAFPLPEAQLDRFAIKLRLGYPDRSSQLRMLKKNHSTSQGCEASLLDLSQLATLQAEVQNVAMHDRVAEYLVDLVEASRQTRGVLLGVSPRGLLCWHRMAQATAMLAGRDFVTPSDILRIARPVMAVRVISEDPENAQAIEDILTSVPVPEYR